MQNNLADALATAKQFRFVAIAAIMTLLSGVVIYHHLEGWRWLDAFYFCVVSLTTVGYGDITPKTDAGKLFTTVYLIIGIAIIAWVINNLLKVAIARKAIRTARHGSTVHHD